MRESSKKLLKETQKIKKPRKTKGTLIVIGGHEDKTNHGIILKIIAKKIGSGKLVVLPFGSEYPEEMKEIYTKAFRRVGIKHLHFINIFNRKDSRLPQKIKALKDAKGVFFTGGDQHKINSLIAYTPFCDAIKNIYENGGLVAGTSAGASALSDTMIVYPQHKVEDMDHNEFDMAPGLGLLPQDILIDQHFSQRSRFGRLLSAVARNPRLLGVGLDENTAIMIEHGNKFKVIGNGLVYVFDGSCITFMDLKDTAYNMHVHIMSQGYTFDMKNRKPIIPNKKISSEYSDEEQTILKLK